MIKAILFDMDGILFDSEGFYFEGNYEQLVELGYKGKKEALLDGIGRTVDGLIDLYYELLNHQYSKEEIRRVNDEYYETHVIDCKKLMFEHVPEMVRKLHADGYKLACCSSSPLKVIEQCLQEMGIREYYDYVQSGEEIRAPKPAPDIYELARDALNVKTEECIVYEDSDTGIKAGKNAGMFVIARKDERFRQSQKKADIIVNNIVEMVEYVERKNEDDGRSN